MSVSGLPRLLRDTPSHGAMTLSAHVAAHGEVPTPRSRRRRGDAGRLIDVVEHAGLLGRGGASFPAARKMRAVRAARGRPIVVANAAEGEPASAKDRMLLSSVPHLVLDGCLLTAHALGASEAIVCISEGDMSSLASVQLALSERVDGAHGAPIRIATVPSGYVSGQESALVNHLNGAPARPTFTPPLPFERGVARRPTLVSNAETLAHVALIARHGPKWFREIGTASQPGSTLVTLSGPVEYPGVYEIEPGTSLDTLIDAAGGPTRTARAAVIGGYGGSWIVADALAGLSLSSEALAAHGASLGPGVVALMSDDGCGVAETARITRWLAEQSTRQCGPCVHGLDALATTLEEVTSGLAAPQATRRIAQLAALARRRGACAHPDGAVRFVVSAIQAFASEFAEHAQYGPCDGCARPQLPLPGRALQASSR